MFLFVFYRVFLSDCIVNFSNCNCKFSITIADRLQLQLQLFLDFFFFFSTCSASRDYIDLPTTESQVPKAFLCWTCYPSSRLNLVTSWVLYFSPFRFQFYWLVYRSNISVKCLAQEHNIIVILAKRSPTLNQIRLSVAYPL